MQKEIIFKMNKIKFYRCQGCKKTTHAAGVIPYCKKCKKNYVEVKIK